MPLINCEINLILTWSATCVITNLTGARIFSITHTKLYVPLVTLLTQGNAKLLQQLKSGFKKTLTWNKYQSKVTIERQDQHLDYLIDPSFQGVNTFCFSIENNAVRTGYIKYFLPTIEIKDYNNIINGQNLFDQPVKNYLRTYDNI